MLMFVWFYVLTQAFVPGAERALSLQAAAFEAQMRAHIECQEDEREFRHVGVRRSVALLEQYRAPNAAAA